MRTEVIYIGCPDPLMVTGGRETDDVYSISQEGIRAVTIFCFWHHSKLNQHPFSHTSESLKFHYSTVFCGWFTPALA